MTRLLAGLVFVCSCFGQAVTVDTALTYQTYHYNMVATAVGCLHVPCTRADMIGLDPNWFKGLQHSYIGKLVNQLGINTVQFTVLGGDVENNADYYTEYVLEGKGTNHAKTPINDDANPNHFNCADPRLVSCPTSFPMGGLDWFMEHYWIGPDGFRQQILNAGRTPHLDFAFQCHPCTAYLPTTPAEMGEQYAAVWIHVANKFGPQYLPDITEIQVEPDVQTWTPTELGNDIAAARSRLAQLGYGVPKFWCCSTSSADHAVPWYKTVKTIAPVDGLSYHTYTGEGPDFTAIREQAAEDGIPNIMTEFDSAGISQVMEQQIYADTSGYNRYTDGGESIICVAFLHVTSSNPFKANYNLTYNCPGPTDPPYFFPNLWGYVQEGSVREGASVTDGDTGDYSVLAYRRPDDGHVVFVRTILSNITPTITVQGLPAGTYGCTYTLNDNNTTELAPCGPNQTIETNGKLSYTKTIKPIARGTTGAVFTFFTVQP